MRYYFFAVIGLAALSLIVLPARAADFSLDDREQSDLAQICEIAGRAPTIPIETNLQVLQRCVQWKLRMKAAAQKPPAEPPPAIDE